MKNLLGDSLVANLQSILARFTGISQESIGKVLGPIAATVMGTLRQQKDEQGLDARGLTGLFESQKTNIASAMPAGLGSMLGNIPGLGDLTGMARGAASTATQASERAYHTAARTGEQAVDTGSSVLKWALPVAGVLLALGLVWWFFLREKPEVVTAPTSTTPTDRGPGTLSTTTSSTSFSNPEATLTAESTSFFRTATETVSSIKDAASAEAARPRLQELSKSLDTIKTGLGAVGAETRATITSTFQDSSGSLTAMLDKALNIPGVREKIGPLVQEIKTKLTSLTGSTGATGDAITGQANEVFQSATETFTSIKDAASAEAARPRLQELSKSLDTLKTGTQSIGADTRTAFQATVKSGTATLSRLIDRVLTIPGVKDKIGPLVEEIRTKLSGLTTS
jgi:hypothetical protein